MDGTANRFVLAYLSFVDKMNTESWPENCMLGDTRLSVVSLYFYVPVLELTMMRRVFAVGICLVALIGPASAQVGYQGGNGFARGVGGLGNAGGFATGPGMANSFQNSSNFGLNAGPRINYGAGGVGAMQGIPGISNYGGAYPSTMGIGNSGIGTGTNVGIAPGGLLPGLPGIAPPGFNGATFGYDAGIGSSDSGYTNFGNALTASALGVGYGGYGYGPMGYGALNYGNVGLGPVGFTYPGMIPGAFMPGAGYVPPDMAAASALNNPPATGRTFTPALAKSVDEAGASSQTNVEQNASGIGVNGNQVRAGRRGFPSDSAPVSTANAVRIQNRLHNAKSPNFKNIKVQIANRTAVLSGTVDSNEDEKLAVRLVGLEPGVVEVKSELVVNGAVAK